MNDPQHNRIIEKSVEKFMHFGIRTISLDDIANDLAISKKTIYKYFDNKADLVKAVTEHIINNVEYSCGTCFASSSNAVSELLNLIEFINGFFTNINPSVMYDLEKYYPESYAIFRKSQDEVVLNQIKDNLKKGIQEELYRADLDIDIVAKLRIGQIQLPFNTDLFNPEEFEIRKVQLVSLELYMMGIVTEKGNKIIEQYKHEKYK